MADELFAEPWTPPRLAPPKNIKVAVVGAGPCGLTAALRLAQQGYGVTVFERMPQPGGMMTYGIPAYRLPREPLFAEIDHIRYCHERGLGPLDLDEITLGGDTSLEEAQARAQGFRTGLIRVEDYFAGTRIKAYAGPPLAEGGPDYCWGGCPGAMEESIEIIRSMDENVDNTMRPLHVGLRARRARRTRTAARPAAFAYAAVLPAPGRPSRAGLAPAAGRRRTAPPRHVARAVRGRTATGGRAS